MANTETATTTIDSAALERFRRWQDFAFRFAKTCYADLPEDEQGEPSLKWLLEQLENFFGCDEYDMGCVKREWAHLYVRWEYSLGNVGYPCDLVSDMMDEIWSTYHGYATDQEIRILDKLDELKEKAPSSDRFDTLAERENKIRSAIVDRWECPLHSCIRAGIDMVFEFQPGVTGFTVGDLRAMYPEGFPEWLQAKLKPEFFTVPDNTPMIM